MIASELTNTQLIVNRKKMSSFMSSSRRRFAPPEKPQPRFEWRMRVHSLMMDERDNIDSLSDRKDQRQDSGLYSREMATDENQNKQEHISNDSDEGQGHEFRRRSRFLRTKSEGYLKVRLRLSKFSDVSKSQDDTEELKCSQAESRDADHRRKSENEDGVTASRSHHWRYHTRRAATERIQVSEDQNVKPNDNIEEGRTSSVGGNGLQAAVDDGNKNADFLTNEPDVESVVDSSCVDQQGAAAELKHDFGVAFNGEDVQLKLNYSQGAIPKRYPNARTLSVSVSPEPGNEDGQNVETKYAYKNSEEQAESINKTFDKENSDRFKSYHESACESSENLDNHELGISPETTNQHSTTDIVYLERSKDGTSQGATSDETRPDKNTDKIFTKTKINDGALSGSKIIGCRAQGACLVNEGARIEENEILVEDVASSLSKSSSVDHQDMDDIESLIEQIIAEEEAILDGKEPSAKLIQKSLKHINKDEISALREKVQNLQNEIDLRTNEIATKKNISLKDQRSSSFPSYSSDDESKIKSVVLYSSSCPHTHEAKDKNKTYEQYEDEDDDEFNSWAYLPVILVEDIFTLLSPKERHQASQVCRQWYDLFYSPRIWETFILLERTLTKKRFNLYKGYQRELCPGKTQLCFRRVGSFFKRIVVTPISDYFNLYEFLRILAAFLQFQEDHGQKAMPLLHTFDFTFACASRSEGVEMVHGTGGQILEMIIQLLLRMNNLKHLKLNQLLVDVVDVPSLFDAIANCFGECLSSLEVLNVTKVPLPLIDLSRFRSLIKLTVSPQHLNDEVVLLLSGLNIMQLHLLQDPYTCQCEPVSSEAWKLAREIAPWLQVYLEVVGITRSHVLIQPRAPVHGVFLRTPYTRLTNDLVMSLVEHYSKTLRYFVQERLPRVHGPRGFNHRSDSSFLFLVRRCAVLHTLVIRERISTSTLILLANEGRRLNTLLVRKNGLIKRCDWPQCGEMSKEFYSNLKSASLDFNKCTDEICKRLKRRWKPTEDKQFMRLKIVPRIHIC